MNHLHTHLILAAVVLGAPLLSQSPTWASTKAPGRQLADAPRTMPWPDRALTDVAADGTIWAGAESWKASFAANGATFHPFLGGDAPACQATFALHAVRCGDHALALTATTPTLQGQQVRYDRGAVRERYDLTTNGIEQQFVFDQLPTRGELQLEVTVTTALAIVADAGGHTLLGDNGGLRYGLATAIDARGATCALTTTFADGAFHLTVPADFVASAAMPLVVDPLIGTLQTLTTSTKELLATDIAYDQSLGQFFVAYERAFSATDHDVFVICTDIAMNWQSTQTIDFTTEYWRRPRIAALEAHDTACVVTETSTGNVSPFAVKARMLVGGPVPQVLNVLPISGSNNDCVEPDIGGDSNVVGDYYLIAYEERSTVNATQQHFLRLHISGLVSTPATLGAGIGIERGVAISKTCGTIGGGTEGWALVHRHEPYLLSTGNLRAWFVGRDGMLRTPVGGYFFVDLTSTTANTGSEWDVSSPTNDALSRNFLCVERRVDPATGRGSIYGTAFDRHGNVVAPASTIVNAAVDRHTPRVDSDGVRFVVANDDTYSASDHDVRVTTHTLFGNQLVTQDNDVVSYATDSDSAPAIVAMPGFQYGAYGLAWAHSDGTSWSLQAQRYQGIGAGGITSRATGCGPINTLAVGYPQLGQNLSIVLGNVTGIPAIIAGTPLSVAIGPCPGCTLGVDGTILLGNQVLIAVPLLPGLVGATVSFQGLQLNAALGGCLGEFQLGNTLDVTVQ